MAPRTLGVLIDAAVLSHAAKAGWGHTGLLLLLSMLMYGDRTMRTSSGCGAALR